MLIPGTQMHIVTFIFVSIEIVILFYLVIYKLARPDDTIASLNIILISLLIIYNVTGGLLPDPNLPGSVFIQETIAYGTGFITPCFFPYYVYKAFGLARMKFHAYKGVFLCLMLPYFLFVIIYAATNKLQVAKNLLILPVTYAAWVIYSLVNAIKYKYRNNFRSKESKQEITVLLLSLTPWIGLPVVSYFNLNQATEACITNPGFLILLALQVSRHIKQLRAEHQRLIDSELHLLNWNTSLQKEVDKRTSELEKINEQKTNTFVNLAHETKTPLTLINNYLEEYINRNGETEELSVVKKNIEKLSNDIVNFFDIERFNKKIPVYNHAQISNVSEILEDYLILFKEYAIKRKIKFDENIESDLLVKADPVSINRIIINVIENAIKFSEDNCTIEIVLKSQNEKINFSVKDCGIGIPPEMHKKVFEPYYQITNEKKSFQGMGLGLPIVKKIIEDLNAKIEIENNSGTEGGITISIILNQYKKIETEIVLHNMPDKKILINFGEKKEYPDVIESGRQSILLVEDNISMTNYLVKKLREQYNVCAVSNGNEALRKIKGGGMVPNLIISDVMMDQLNGYDFVKIISRYPSYNHIPVMFLSAKATNEDKLLGLGLGAIDFIQKPFKINELLKKIESILINANRQKQAVLSNAFRTLNSPENLKLNNSYDLFKQNCDLYKLTSRERDIVKLICEGHKYKLIAEILFISEKTVTKHVQNIFEKLEVSNKIELINKLEAA
jgi:signal transduction histidine kinase/DNA-binding NarL/FixJ family response regulator